MKISIVLAWAIPSLVSTSELSLPQHDLFPDNRQQGIDRVASSIHNEIRSHTVNGQTFTLNHGPRFDPDSLALSLLFEESFLLESNANPDVIEIFATAESFNISSLTDYDGMYAALSQVIEDPLARDSSDEAFAQDRLTIKGTRLKIATDPALDLRLTKRQVRSACGESSVRKIQQKNRLFMEDLSFASDFNDLEAPSKFAPSSIGYFCVTKDRERFMPLAIHLLDTDLIYHPDDPSDEWMLAKMSLNSASMNVQQMDHFIQTHMILEPLRVELLRHVSPRHPIYNLLEHHFRQLFANTPAGLTTLLSSGTTYDKIFGWGATGSLKFLQEELPKESSFQSFGDRSERYGLNYIPEYKCGDDGKKIWTAIRQFLTSHLNAYYRSNASSYNAFKSSSSSSNGKRRSSQTSSKSKSSTNLRNSASDQNMQLQLDGEVQSWASASCSLVPNFPCEFDDLEEMIETLTDIIFRVSVQHHVWNSDATWHIFAYPFSLPSLNHPLPTRKGDPLDLMDYVLPRHLLGQSLASFAAFKRPIHVENTILESYNSVDLGTKSERAIAEFQAELRNIEEEIDVRESNAARPFNIMKPSRLPHYVWI